MRPLQEARGWEEDGPPKAPKGTEREAFPEKSSVLSVDHPTHHPSRRAFRRGPSLSLCFLFGGGDVRRAVPSEYYSGNQTDGTLPLNPNLNRNRNRCEGRDYD